MTAGEQPAGSVLTETRPIPDSDGLSGWVRMNRPESLNPLDWDTIRTLREAFESLAADDDVRVIFVTGTGRAFSAGGDMKKYIELQRDVVGFPEFVKDCHELFAAFRTYRQPVVALVNGVSVAGGTEMILYCDFAIAADTARIGDAHLNFGQMGGGGVLAMLPLVVGPTRARELILTGRLLDAAEAADWGIVSRVVPAAELETAAEELAAQIAAKSPLAVANAKRVINSAFWSASDVPARMSLELETNLRYCLTSEDAPEGLAAFSEKRRPRFTGR